MRRERRLEQVAERLAKLKVPQALDDRFGKYVHDSVAFVRVELGADPEPYQVEILTAAVTSPRIAWRAAHGVGKTCVLAWLLMWWLVTRPFSRVLVLAPAFERQVGRYLLPEVKKWTRRAPVPLPLAVRANSVEVIGFEREWFALAVQATDASKVEGGHAASLCVLADEAKALPAEVVAALHGSQTDVGGDRLYVLASVPGGPSGPFYDVFRSGANLWRLFHTKAADSRLVSPTWITERGEEWGPLSPLYVARVLGEFPDEAEGTLYRLTDLEAAVARTLVEPAEASVRLGVDCARFGDDASTIATWRGRVLDGVALRRNLDTMALAAWVASEINHARPMPSRVTVDEIGLGSGVVDRLKQLGFPQVVGLNAGSAAHEPRLYLNRRAEIAFELRTALERGEVSLPSDAQLLAELSAIRYEFTSRGQLRLEEKAETKKRVGHSPDRADAVMLGFSGTVALPGRRWGYVKLINGRAVPVSQITPWGTIEVYHPGGDEANDPLLRGRG